MSRSPSVVRFIAEQHGVSERTVERWFQTGTIGRAYRTKGGHWRLRKLNSDGVEKIINAHNAVLLRQIKAEVFPHFDEVMELTYVAAGITNDDIRAVTHPNPDERKRNIETLRRQAPEKWRLLCHTHFEIDPQKFRCLSQLVQEPRIRLGVKAQILRSHGYEVTPVNLAAILSISPATLYRRFGRETVRSVCRSRRGSLIRGTFRHDRTIIRQQAGNSDCAP